MKKMIACILGLFLLSGAACGETSSPGSAVLPAEKALVKPVAQQKEDWDGEEITVTCYEVTVPIELPVTVCVQQEDGAFKEEPITTAVAQITYYMETYFQGERLGGGGTDVLHYPKLSWLGVPPYPGGPYLPQGSLPTDILYQAKFAMAETPSSGGFNAWDSGQFVTVKLTGGSFTLTYVSAITLDSSGVAVGMATSTETIPCDFACTFRADAPEYTGQIALPTFEEWMGVPSIPR